MSYGMSHRTYGETGDCMGCRYWSEMVAQSQGSEIVAMCLNPQSPKRGKFMRGRATCTEWDAGDMGAIDEPGGNPYEEETA